MKRYQFDIIVLKIMIEASHKATLNHLSKKNLES